MRKIVFVLLLAIVSAGASTAVSAQDIAGRVLDGRKGMEGVIVSNGYDVTITDADGRYTLPYHAKAYFVNITVPAGYEIPEKYSLAAPYRAIKEGTSSYDFTLRRGKKVSDDFTFMVTSDLTLYSEYNVTNWERNMVQDMIDLRARSYKSMEVYGMVLGDIIWTNEPRYADFKQVIAKTYFPFFTVIGDYDHDREQTNSDSAKDKYLRNLGPRNYGFQRGKFHFIVLDDIIWQTRQKYTPGIDEDQIKWLQQYLSYIPEGANLVLAMHAPVLRRRAEPNNLTNTDRLMALVKPYNVHVLSGHMRYMENYRRRNFYQHGHTAASGVLNTYDMNRDGTPNGYTVYEFRGDDLTWYYKPLSRDRSWQFSVSPRGSHPTYPDKLIVNVWNWDERWKVEWLEDGKPAAGQAERVNDYAVEFQYGAYKPQADALRTPVKVYHLFKLDPTPGVASIVVKVTDAFGNVYTREVKKP